MIFTSSISIFHNLALNPQEMLLVLITFEDTPISTELILLDGDACLGFWAAPQ